MSKVRQEAKQIQKTLQELIEQQPNDQRLRDHIEGLTRSDVFSGLTWFWGPMLYERNRVLFRPLILNHFSDWMIEPNFRWARVRWTDYADELETWLASARKHRDTTMVRKLMQWRYAPASGWRINTVLLKRDMIQAYRDAPTAAARAIVLDEYDLWFQFDEDSAIELYGIDHASSAMILRHLPVSFWGSEKRKRWLKLEQVARDAQDKDFANELYRKMVPVKEWQQDALRLTRSVREAEELNDELEQIHPTGYGLDLVSGMVQLLEARGRDVMPYVRANLNSAIGGWFGSRGTPLIKLAAQRGWWDLWATAIRLDRNPSTFNKAVSDLLNDNALPDEQRLDRLRALAGASREWNWAGFGMVTVHGLEDKLAAAMYERYPDLIHGPYKVHVTPSWWGGYPLLLEAAQQANDEELIDLMASRYVTRASYSYIYGHKQQDKLMETADKLGDYYQAIRDRDPSAFAQRASNVLTRVPAFSIYDYHRLLKTNKLARLMFVRSFESYLEVPGAVCDLIEGSDIHVQMLAYRVLAQDNEKARALAAEQLDILLGTLLRPIHRKTRLPAFDALANAARYDAASAKRVRERARLALRLPDQKYPKEQLIGLIGRVLHAYPGLRLAAERPVVYGLEEAAEVVT